MRPRGAKKLARHRNLFTKNNFILSGVQVGPRSARTSSMCSPGRKIGWGWPCEPSALPAPPSRSVWPIWSITSSAWLGSRGELRPLDRKTPTKSAQTPNSHSQRVPQNAFNQHSAPLSRTVHGNPAVFRVVHLKSHVAQTHASPWLSEMK